MTVRALKSEHIVTTSTRLALTGPELDTAILNGPGALYPDAALIELTDYHDEDGPDLKVTVYGNVQTPTGRRGKGRSSKVYYGDDAGLFEHPEPELAGWNPPEWLRELVKGYVPAPAPTRAELVQPL